MQEYEILEENDQREPEDIKNNYQGEPKENGNNDQRQPEQDENKYQREPEENGCLHILEINSILKICKGCSENLQRSYEFKTFCFDRRDVKDLENNETAIMVQKSDYKCRLCWESLEINALDEVESEQPSLELMMKECLPDLPEDKNQAYEAQFCFVKIENADTHSEKIDTAKDHINPISICKMEPDEKEDDEFDELTGRNDAQVKTELIEEEE
ncbi:hypothetical protein NQ314_002275, partial [Rhamnusium bicolor]